MAAKDPRGTPTIPITHPGFLLSCGFGAVGLLLLVTGLIVGGKVIFVVGVLFGALSLLAALAWRSDLVSAWKKNQAGK